MFDVKNRREFLEYSKQSLDGLAVLNEAMDFPAEFDEPYEKFLDSVCTFQNQFKHRIRMLDEPQFKNAHSDDELRRAAIKRKFDAQAFLNDFHARKESREEKFSLCAFASDVLKDEKMEDEIAKELWEDGMRAAIAKAHAAECDVLIKATSQKEAKNV